MGMLFLKKNLRETTREGVISRKTPRETTREGVIWEKTSQKQRAKG